MFQLLNMTDLYALERDKPVQEIVAIYGNCIIASGVSVADYYTMLDFFRKTERPVSDYGTPHLNPEMTFGEAI